MFFSKKYKIIAPVSGKCASVSQSTDAVFKDKVLGDGIVIAPENGKILAPVAGTVVQVAHTKHAFAIEGDSGAEVLVHLGVDTVKLGGEGFTCHKAAGDKVKAGDHFMDMDISLIRERGYSPEVLCIVLNLDEFKDLSIFEGMVEAGNSDVMTLTK